MIDGLIADVRREGTRVVCNWKVGKNVCLALSEAGFVVYGTSRSGIVPGYNGVKCNYADKKSLDIALKETGIKLVFGITDTFQSAELGV